MPKLLGERGGIAHKLFPETTPFPVYLSTFQNKGHGVAQNYGDSCSLEAGLTAAAYFAGSSNWSLSPGTL